VLAVKAWHAAGIPMDKIVLGVADYCHSFSVANVDAFPSGSKGALATHPKFNVSNQPLGQLGQRQPRAGRSSLGSHKALAECSTIGA
jgi:hypothetical protein